VNRKRLEDLFALSFSTSTCAPAPGRVRARFRCGAGGMLDALQRSGWETRFEARHAHGVRTTPQITALPNEPQSTWSSFTMCWNTSAIHYDIRKASRCAS
jgi:hypothetical protein